MNTSRTRHQFYLPDDLSERLEALAAKPGASKTAILTEALTAWLDRRAGNELEDKFGRRLDRQSRSADRTEQKIDYLLEAFGVFIRHQLTLTAHHPAFDAETNRVGRLRYDDFIRLIGRAIARGDTATRLGQAAAETAKPIG